MKCAAVTIKRRKVCFGDLNRKIKLYIRTLTAPDDSGEVDYEQTFSGERTVWSSVQTSSGKDIFDGTNMIGTASHFFYIKYISGLTSEDMVEWQSENYRILRLENLDENNEYMKLYCSLRGTTGNEVNFQ